MRKKLVFAIAIVLCSFTAFSQDEETTGFNKDKFFAGGNFGLSVGSYTVINLSPQVGYRFNRFLASGVGLNLLYYSHKEKDVYGNDYRKVVQGITGLNVFARFYPTSKIFIQVQPEDNYIFGKQIFYQPTKEVYKLDAELIPSILVGGGLATPTSRGAVLFSVMFDMLQNPNSPYGNRPIVNVGYNFNF